MRLVKLCSTNIELTPAIRAYVEERLVVGLQKFVTHYDPDGAEISIEVGKISHHHKKGEVFRAEANLKIPGSLLRVSPVRDDLYAAIDAAKDELRRELLDLEDKSRTTSRRRGSLLKKMMNFAAFRGKRTDQDDLNNILE